MARVEVAPEPARVGAGGEQEDDGGDAEAEQDGEEVGHVAISP